VPYPIIKKADARAYLMAQQSESPTTLPDVGRCEEGDEVDWERLAEDLAGKLLALAEKTKNDKGELRGAHFELAAAEIVHASLYPHPAFGDGEFWIWLTLCYFQDVIKSRYPGGVNLKNYGVGGETENFLYRLWLRAEVAYDEENKDHYHLCRCGDIDFWRSHIFRQSYGDVRKFAKALIRFQFPIDKENKPRLKIDEIRALAKHLKRARSNLMFEVMTEERAAKFIESEWTRLAPNTV
jgi:hypothetical protein